MHEVANIASAIIFLAMIAVLVKSRYTTGILSALGGQFQGAIKTAEAG